MWNISTIFIDDFPGFSRFSTSNRKRLRRTSTGHTSHLAQEFDSSRWSANSQSSRQNLACLCVTAVSEKCWKHQHVRCYRSKKIHETGPDFFPGHFWPWFYCPPKKSSQLRGAPRSSGRRLSGRYRSTATTSRPSGPRAHSPRDEGCVTMAGDDEFFFDGEMMGWVTKYMERSKYIDK